MLLMDEIRALAAVGNLGEFCCWALEDVAPSSSTPASALPLPLSSFQTELE